MSAPSRDYKKRLHARRKEVELLVLDMICNVDDGDTIERAFVRFAQAADQHITPDMIVRHHAGRRGLASPRRRDA